MVLGSWSVYECDPALARILKGPKNFSESLWDGQVDRCCACRRLKGVVSRCYDKFEGFQAQPSTMTSSSESTVSQVVVV